MDHVSYYCSICHFRCCSCLPSLLIHLCRSRRYWLPLSHAFHNVGNMGWHMQILGRTPRLLRNSRCYVEIRLFFGDLLNK